MVDAVAFRTADTIASVEGDDRLKSKDSKFVPTAANMSTRRRCPDIHCCEPYPTKPGNRMSRKLESLLTPGESVVALVDYQPQLLFGVGSHERHMVLNNAVALAKAARLFDVPIVLTTVAARTFGGALLPEIQAVFADQVPIDRTTMNCWEDKHFNAAVTGFGRNKIIIAGLWTEICVCFPALDAIAEGYDVHVPTDACGDVTVEAHERAVQRGIQAGIVPMTTLQVMFEWQRDWARPNTYDGCMEILRTHSAILGEQAREGNAM
jgi:nicotinamidase-related amidase